ncbi:MAG: glycosyltransferase, partial [Acidimicrobiales bacterium]|nr:glycosyltransferase [Acidimicrobiales bacterium]
MAVVLPVRDEASTFAHALRSVLDQDVPASLEVYVAVGPSVDDTRAVADALAASDPRVTVLDNPAGVTPAGLNQAIRATSAPIVVRVDGHADLPAGYVARA